MCKILQEAHCSWVQSFTCSLLVGHLKILCSHGSKAIKDALDPRVKRLLQKCFALAMKIENKAFGNIVMGRERKLTVSTCWLWTLQQHEFQSSSTEDPNGPGPLKAYLKACVYFKGTKWSFCDVMFRFISFWLSTEKKAREEGKPFWDAHGAQEVEREKHWAASNAVTQPALGIPVVPHAPPPCGFLKLAQPPPWGAGPFSQLLGQLTVQNLAITGKLMPFCNCLLHIFPSLASKEESI